MGDVSPLQSLANYPTRVALLLAPLAALLVACGGGGAPADAPVGPPAISDFSADAPHVFVGDSAVLTGRFQGGAGRIEPQLGPVTSGVATRTPVLDRASTFRLVVEAPGQPPTTRDVTIGVRFRNHYAAAGTFVASQHSATLAGDGSVILVGGSRGLSALSESIDRFDPRTGVTSRIGGLTSGRSAHRATRLANGAILITGGLVSQGDSRVVELIDERSGASSGSGTMSVPRIDHGAIALPGGAVLVTGGYSSGEGAVMGISDSAELWEPATQRFRRLATRMRMARAAHTMTLLPDGRVLIVGGYAAAASYQFAEIFDPQTERFAAVESNRPLRANHVAHAQEDGRVLILGGETVEAGTGAIQPLASVVRFDPATGAFSDVAPLATPRTWAASVMLPGGEVLLFGGQQEMPQYTASAESYHPSTGGTVIASLDGQRALHTATRLDSGRVLVAGGEAWGGAYTGSLLVYE
jgi:hypothetical protein